MQLLVHASTVFLFKIRVFFLGSKLGGLELSDTKLALKQRFFRDQ